MIYKVKLDVFEGPFDLLVYLIENAQMSIYDIQVSVITKQYMEYVEKIQKIDAVIAGEFMVLAATLIEIKSKMLLPKKNTDDPELPDDPRNELVQRLVEYKRFKKAAAYLEKLESRMQRIHTKPKEDLTIYTKEPDVFLSLDLNSFMKAFHLFVHRKKQLEDVQKRYNIVRQHRMTVESRIEQIIKLLEGKKKIGFGELLEDERSRRNVVLTFLSMLELIKQKAVQFKQNKNCGDIVFIVNESSTKAEKGE